MPVRPRPLPRWFVALLVAALTLPLLLGRAGTANADTPTAPPQGPARSPPNATELLKLPPIPNERCLHCHTDENQKTSVREDGSEITIYIDRERFERSVHGHQPCVGCHNSIKRAAHEIPLPKSIGCVQCHLKTAEAQRDDFENYPEMWIAARFMSALIIGVFLFFWTHMLLWSYREWRERKAGIGYRPDPAHPPQVYFRRVSLGWRLVHGGLALSVMALVLTGTAVLFGEQGWAQYIMHLIGGPKVAAIVHRVAAITLILIFFGHLGAVTWTIVRASDGFRWFGPTSMVPNRRDIRDIGRMFAWFLGRAPRPRFGRWTYWEKFDYWAPFWGMAVVGTSGLMLWFPQVTASVLPGWVFNIATIVHADEAVLAAVFIFTVHYFNAHFRPEKFPMDIVMVTGAVPLPEFKHEHALEYERLAASGELARYLVKPPTERAQRIGRKITGWLIVIGLILAGLVVNGFVAKLA